MKRFFFIAALLLLAVPVLAQNVSWKQQVTRLTKGCQFTDLQFMDEQMSYSKFESDEFPNGISHIIYEGSFEYDGETYPALVYYVLSEDFPFTEDIDEEGADALAGAISDELPDGISCAALPIGDHLYPAIYIVYLNASIHDAEQKPYCSNVRFIGSLLEDLKPSFSALMGEYHSTGMGFAASPGNAKIKQEMQRILKPLHIKVPPIGGTVLKK